MIQLIKTHPLWVVILFFAFTVGDNAFSQTLPTPIEGARLDYGEYKPQTSGAISSNRKRALELFTNITGVKIGIDDPRLVKMENYLNNNQDGLAVEVATSDKNFFNVRLLSMSKEMSNRAETNRVYTNDFSSSFVGGIRDGMNAKELILQNFYYKTNADKYSSFNAFDLGPNESAHFIGFDGGQFSLYDNAIKDGPQIFEDILNGQGSGDQPASNADAAGLITSRTFMLNHADAGTNRRIVEFTFKSFMCVEMEDWKDLSRPDSWVGLDVDRMAGGSTQRYQNDCRGCHAQLDGFRSAFAHFDFNKKVRFFKPKVHQKITNNNDVYPSGHPVRNDNFVNNALGPLNMDRFGWRLPNGTSGTGPNDFAKMIADSKGFSRCFVRRFFTKICRRPPSVAEENVVRNLADQFESTYLIPDLVKLVALHPNCLPE